MREFIRIASGQGFWGDLQTAPMDQVRLGPIDYLVMDYLAEVTMSILHKQKSRNPILGYATDLIPLLEEILPDIVRKKIAVITNAGGANPIACRDALSAVVRKLGVGKLRVGIVFGDDIFGSLDTLAAKGIPLDNMETGEKLASVRSRLISANVYLGASPIVAALKQGAQIVITGRTADASLALAPMIYEFDWPEDDWDRRAAGIVAGHILECGGQASGGNFMGDWRSVPDLAHIGFPIAEVYPDGRFVITKHPATGGLVSCATVKEQLVYEIANPREYVTPDCVADFTTLRLEEIGANTVQVTGVKGKPATPFFKASMAFLDGYSAVGMLTYAWPGALEKARKADEILRDRLARLNLHFEAMRTEFLGYDSCFGPRAPLVGDLNEVVLRIAVRSKDRSAVERFGKELAPLILTGPPGATGYAGGRPKPVEVMAYWPALCPKSDVTPRVLVDEVP